MIDGESIAFLVLDVAVQKRLVIHSSATATAANNHLELKSCRTAAEGGCAAPNLILVKNRGKE
jgi:hypothetical protein